MTLDDVKAYYKTSYNFEESTGMSHANFNNWEERGYIPLFTQYRLQRMTNGALRVSQDDTRPD